MWGWSTDMEMTPSQKWKTVIPPVKVFGLLEISYVNYLIFKKIKTMKRLTPSKLFLQITIISLALSMTQVDEHPKVLLLILFMLIAGFFFNEQVQYEMKQGYYTQIENDLYERMY